MTVVLKISKPTKNVLTATSLDDFYLHSSYPLLKVHTYGTFSFPVALKTTTITHNLGYRPFTLVFSKAVIDDYGTVSAEYCQHDWFVGGGSVFWWGYTRIYTDRLLIAVGESNAFIGGSVQGFYYIFQEDTVAWV